MPNTEKQEMLRDVRKHIKSNPKSTFADLVAELNLTQLSTVQFYNIKAQLRRKGLLPDAGESKVAERSKPMDASPRLKPVQIEILDSIDISNLSRDILDHYQSHIIGLLRKLVPNGKNLRLSVLSDPPTLEIQRVVL
jgi:hypothetical protein